MFVIPFVFALYPEILLIEAAIIDPTSASGASGYLPGYDGERHLGDLAILLARLGLALYLLASALARHDGQRLSVPEVALRIALFLFLLSSNEWLYLPAAVIALLVIFLANRKGQRRPAKPGA
jgi:TRAP-type uncharacterized transport system fused permease subunit